MGDINVIPRVETIHVAPARQSINVLNMPRNEAPIPQPAGARFFYSDPNNYSTGILSTGGDQGIYNFRLPAKVKVGDHIRVTNWGSLGDNVAGAHAWMFKSWINGYEQSAIYPYVGTPTPAGQRVAFIQELDIVKQSPTSAWLWHRISTGRAATTATVQTAPGEGLWHTLAVYAHPAIELSGASLALTAKYSGGDPSSVYSRGLMVEHLIAP
jgi:hypothetical protein